MRIGELAKKTATQIETIRYYEKQGLLPEPPRSEGNFREYHALHEERLNFIRQCRSLDMSLDEIRRLLLIKDSPSAECGDVNQLVDDHVQHVEQRIAELQALAQQLHVLRDRCLSAKPAEHCGILQELSSGAVEAAQGGVGHISGVHGVHSK
ncbi:Cd(II)/Pb(II)-responsive transcriptional regulator [Pseudomonas sp. F1_0610]|uniref:Cd(II)/Pb(II)-responsive transcriptional regulator n=1 Tax=Pseudomonas sp. F1_0610 TaxID=3114284 RepID=UPI0039C3513E